MVFWSRRIAAWCFLLPVPFRAYLVSGCLAALGRNGYLLAAAWILAQASDSAHAVAEFFLIASITELLASPLAGLAADRFNRTHVYQVTEIARFAVIVLTGLAVNGSHRDMALYISAALFSICDRISLTAFQALLPAVSSSTPIMNASALAFFMVQLGNLAAALLCGLLFAVVGSQFVFFLLAFFSLMGAAVSYAGGRGKCHKPAGPAHTRGAFPRLDGNLLRLAADYSLLYGTGVLVSVMGAAYILQDLKGSVADYGIMEACWSLGSIFGALLPVIGFAAVRQQLMHLVLLQAIAVALMCVWVSAAPLHLLIFVLIGAGFNAGRVGVEAWLHRHVRPAEQGRAKGFLHSVAMALAILIFALCATLAKGKSPASVFAVYGAIVMSVSLGLYFVFEKRGTRQARREKH